LELREISYLIHRVGQRDEACTLITTLKDQTIYFQEYLILLYQMRWHVEVDIRVLKQTMKKVHFSCKTPEMIGKEFWMTMITYNLMRSFMCRAAAKSGVLPRQISFKTATINLAAMLSAIVQQDFDKVKQEQLINKVSRMILYQQKRVSEPRVIKKRNRKYPLMQKPRSEYKKTGTTTTTTTE
jgi:hypothetical protein